MSEEKFTKEDEKWCEEVSAPFLKIINELAESKLNLSIDLATLSEAYKEQEKELEYFRNLATPEQRQVYRILKQN
jgi:hypothetical protein